MTRLYTGADGKTKVEEFEIPLKGQGRGTELSTIVPVTGVQFRRTNQDYNLDWHPAPARQFVVTLSGESEVELEGGRKIRLGPGHILLAEDTTGQGHISRAVGSQERLSLFIPLAEGAVYAVAVRASRFTENGEARTVGFYFAMSIAVTYSRVIRAMFEIGISFGHTASHSPSFEQLPKPSASA